MARRAYSQPGRKDEGINGATGRGREYPSAAKRRRKPVRERVPGAVACFRFPPKIGAILPFSPQVIHRKAAENLDKKRRARV